MLHPQQENALRAKLQNVSSNITIYQSRIDEAIATIDTYKVKKQEAIEQEKELKKLLFEFTDIMVEPAEVNPGGTVTISVLVENVSSIEDSCSLTLRVNGIILGEREVDPLGSGATRVENHQISRDEPGTYEVDVNNLIGSFVVRSA